MAAGKEIEEDIGIGNWYRVSEFAFFFSVSYVTQLSCHQTDMTEADLKKLLADNEVQNFDPVAEAFKVRLGEEMKAMKVH